MKRSAFLAALALIAGLFCFERDGFPAGTEIDSLSVLINSNIPVDEKFNHIVDISRLYYKNNDLDSAFAWINRAKGLSSDVSGFEQFPELLYIESRAYRKTSQPEEAFISLQLHNMICETRNDWRQLAKGKWLLGALYEDRSDAPAAISSFKKSLEYFKEERDSLALISIYQSLGNSFLMISEYDSSIMNYHRAIRICEPLGLEHYLASIYNQIGKVYTLQGQTRKAREYLEKSLAINQKYANTSGLGLNYANLGNLANKLDSVDQALFYYDRARIFHEEVGDLNGLADIFNNKGVIYRKQSRYREALLSFNQAIETYRKTGRQEGIILGLQNKAVVFSQEGEYNRATTLFDSCTRMFREAGMLHREMALYRDMSEHYARFGQYRKAFEYHVAYQHLSDTLFTIKRAEMINYLQIEYETEKKLAENLALKNQNLEIKLTIGKRTRQRNIISFIGIGILALGLFLFLYMRQKAIKNRIIAQQKIRQLEEEKKLLAARSLVEGQEEERKRIARELHDGLGVLLSTTKMQFSALSDRSPKNKDLIERANKLLEQASGDVRKISHNMMPGLLTKFGLYEAVDDLFDKLSETEKVKVRADIPEDAVRLPENSEIMLYRIIQELVNNTLKHAGATNIEIQMQVIDDHLDIIYTDDGKGFNVEEKTSSKSIGLTSIASRVNFLNGNMEVRSGTGKGVTYKFDIPL